MNDNQSVDFYTMKVFLYKYTPEFRRVTDAESDSTNAIQDRTVNDDGSINVTGGKDFRNQTRLSKIERYKIDLDEDKFFSMYDISEFVSSYNFSQDLSNNTFNWSIVFQNTVIPFSKLKSLKVVGPELNSSFLKNLSLYEAQASELVDLNFIKEAKSRRGRKEQPLQSRSPLPRESFVSDVTKKFAENFGLAKKKIGLQLQDLVQPYDIISVFLYRNTKRVEERFGNVRVIRDVKENEIKIFNPNPIGEPLTNFLTDEQILLSPDLESKVPNKTLFNNEFNGFVLTKSLSVSAGNVDTLTVTGNGISRLFGATRRLLKTSLLQNDIFTTNEIQDPLQYTSYENIYADKSVSEIFLDLFDTVYRIKPPASSASKEEKDQFPSTKLFHDITSMQVGNRFNFSPFVIPPFLLSLVMKRRGFRVREPNDSGALARIANTSRVNAINSKKVVENQGEEEKTSQEKITTFQVINDTINDLSALQAIKGFKSPVFFSSELNKLRAFFRFFGDVLTDFDPHLQTPFQIIDEVKRNTFLEFYERPDGIVIIRPPEYNDRTNVIKSSTIDIINTSYDESVSDITSKQRVGYSIDGLPSVSPLEGFFFTNGKLLKQFGHMETSAEANPNAKDGPKFRNVFSKVKRPGMFKYAEYLLRLSNASLKTGSVIAAYDPRIVIGRTFFDERNQKFGYIVSVNKSTTTGGAVNVTFNLLYVRDAYIDENGDVQFEPLDRLIDLVQEFDDNQLADKNFFDPEPSSIVDKRLNTITFTRQPIEKTVDEIDDNDVDTTD